MEMENENLKVEVFDEKNLFKYIVKYIKKVDKIRQLKGRKKKIYVQHQLTNLLGKETYDRYSPYISLAIDFIIELTKDKNILKGINTKMNLSFCCLE